VEWRPAPARGEALLQPLDKPELHRHKAQITAKRVDAVRPGLMLTPNLAEQATDMQQGFGVWQSIAELANQPPLVDLAEVGPCGFVVVAERHSMDEVVDVHDQADGNNQPTAARGP